MQTEIIQDGRTFIKHLFVVDLYYVLNSYPNIYLETIKTTKYIFEYFCIHRFPYRYKTSFVRLITLIIYFLKFSLCMYVIGVYNIVITNITIVTVQLCLLNKLCLYQFKCTLSLFQNPQKFNVPTQKHLIKSYQRKRD